MKKFLPLIAALVCSSCSFTRDTTVVTPMVVLTAPKEATLVRQQKTCIYVPPDTAPMMPFDMARYDALPSSAVTQKMLMMVAYIEYLRKRDISVQNNQLAALTIYNNCLQS